MPDDVKLEVAKIRAMLAKSMPAAEEFYKKEKFQDCLRLLNVLEMRMQRFKKQLVPELFELYDKRCLVHRRMSRYRKAHLDASLMIRLDQKAYKGYLCTGKVFEMEGNSTMALKMYTAGMEHVRKDDKNYQKLKYAFHQLEKHITSKTHSKISSSRTDPMTILPYADIFHQILAMVPMRTVVTCMKVSKYWRQMILADQYLWCKNLDLSTNVYKWKQLSEIKNMLKPALAPSTSMIIGTLRINRIQPSSQIAYLNYFARALSGRLRDLCVELDSLAIFTLFSTTHDTIFNGLDKLTITSPFSFDILKALLDRVPSLRELDATYLSSDTPNSYHDVLKLSQKGLNLKSPPEGPYALERLALRFIDNDDSPSKTILLIRDRLPLLKHLLIHYSKRGISRPGVYNILETALPHLESFSVSNDTQLRFQFKSNCIKAIAISHTSFAQVFNLPPPASTSTEEVRLSHCKYQGEASCLLDNLKCGPNLVHLFVEFTALPALFTAQGYMTFISGKYPHLRTISLAGNNDVTDATARAIALSSNVPLNVILSMTRVTDVGSDHLVKAGVKKLGIQNCSVSMASIKRYTDMGVKLLQYKRFHQDVK